MYINMVNTEPKGELNRCPGSIYNIPGISYNGSAGSIPKENVKTTYAQYLAYMKEIEDKKQSEKVAYNARVSTNDS